MFVGTGAACRERRAVCAWLERVNFYRAAALLPPVVEEPTLSATVAEHGRSILASRDAIVIIPREPLTFGSRYRVQVEADGRFIDWTFGVEQISN